MTPEEFVTLFKHQKESMLQDYLSDPPTTAVGTRIKRLQLSPEQLSEMTHILNDTLTDAFYSILLGLDGCASLGDIQQDYHIHTESGALITKGAMLDDIAWEQFHNPHSASS